jgi:hypothetical protein
MASETATIPVPLEVAQSYAISSAQLQQDIQAMLRTSLTAPSSPSHPSIRYDEDVYAWAQEQAAFLRQGAWQALDLEHLSEEIEDVAHSQQDKLGSHLRVLLTHLLKLYVTSTTMPHDYARASRGWRQTCRAQRLEIAKVLRRNRSLERELEAEIAHAYQVARLETAAALEIEESVIPEASAWQPRQILDADFWPEASEESHPTDAR